MSYHQELASLKARISDYAFAQTDTEQSVGGDPWRHRSIKLVIRRRFTVELIFGRSLRSK